ncbi:TetR/AcrR family transcriptional regulator [Rhodovibrionaceae bacterium A322]
MVYRKTKRVEDKMASARAAIFSAAQQLVEDGGWKACNVTAVARLAGLSTGSIYTHFGRITDLQCAVYRRIGDRELARIRTIAEEDSPALDRMERAVRCFAARALRGRIRAYAMIAEPAHPELEALKGAYHRTFIELFQDLLSAALEEGVVPEQPTRPTAAFLFGAVVETLIYPLSDAESSFIERDAQLIDQLVTLTFRTLGAADPSGSLLPPFKAETLHDL